MMNADTDYDKALYYTYCCNWDQLLVLMVQTKDEVFSKRIEHFLHAYKYAKDLGEVDKQLQLMFQYIDHASQKAYIEQMDQLDPQFQL